MARSYTVLLSGTPDPKLAFIEAALSAEGITSVRVKEGKALNDSLLVPTEKLKDANDILDASWADQDNIARPLRSIPWYDGTFATLPNGRANPLFDSRLSGMPE